MISEAIMMMTLLSQSENNAIDSGLADFAKSIASLVEKKHNGNLSPDEVMDLVVNGKEVLGNLVKSIEECIQILDDEKKDEIEKYTGKNPEKTMLELERVIDYGNVAIIIIDSFYQMARSAKVFQPFEILMSGYFKEFILKLSALRNYTQTLHRQFNQYLEILPAVEDEFCKEDIILFDSSVAVFNRALESGNLKCQ